MPAIKATRNVELNRKGKFFALATMIAHVAALHFLRPLTRLFCLRFAWRQRHAPFARGANPFARNGNTAFRTSNHICRCVIRTTSAIAARVAHELFTSYHSCIRKPVESNHSLRSTFHYSKLSRFLELTLIERPRSEDLLKGAFKIFFGHVHPTPIE